MKAWDLTELKINNSQGLGSTPNNQNVDYVGLRVMMTPLTFLKLALPINPRDSDDKKTIDYIQQHLDNPGIGAPFLDIKIPPEWFEGDFSRPASVSGHDGRHRMYAAAAAQGNQPIEVHLFPRGGLRNRDLNAKIVQHLQHGLKAEGSQGYVRGPIFQLADSLQEGRIIFGDEPVDLYLQGKNRQGDLIKQLIKQGVPANRVDQVIRQLADQFNINPNAVVWGISNKPVDEVAMNPRAFANSIAQAHTDKVLVGYEFEVCIPRATIDGPTSQQQQQSPEEFGQRVANLINDEYMDLDIRWQDSRFDKFFTVFKFREPNQYPEDVKSIRQAYMQSILPQIIEMFNRVPEQKRIQYIESTKENLEGDNGYRRATQLGKQFIFARAFGKKVYYDNRGALEQLGADIDKLADRPQRLDYVLLFALGIPTNPGIIKVNDDALDRIRDDFLNYFTYENPQAAYDYLELDYYENDDDDWDNDDPVYSKAANQVLKPAIESTFGVDVKVFNDYHQARKNLTSWYIEPDGSLDADNDMDTTAEIVTPPMGAKSALDVINKFYGLAEKLKLYTNSTTGLHINVSIPKTLDVLKLTVLLGEQYVLKYFGREDSGYARSVMQALKYQGSAKLEKGFKGTTRQLEKLQKLAKDISANHVASVSFNRKYVSFRHAGGNYLADPTGTVLTVSRFIQAMVIASDPAAYRNEYLATLARMFPQPSKEITGTGPRADRSRMLAVLQQIREQGWPAIQRDYAVVEGNIQVPGIRATTAISKTPGLDQSRQVILAQMSSRDSKAKITQLPQTNFVRVVGILNDLDEPVSGYATGQVFKATRAGTKYWFTDQVVRVPATTPEVQQLIRQMAEPYIQQYRTQKQQTQTQLNKTKPTKKK